MINLKKSTPKEQFMRDLRVSQESTINDVVSNKYNTPSRVSSTIMSSHSQYFKPSN